MCCIFCDQLSTSEHSVSENGQTVTNIEICISEFGAHFGYFAAVLFADLADHTNLPQWGFTVFCFR